MASRPRVLDLFCGAGGAAMGYARAGYDVTGVDLWPQPHFPFDFTRADAMTFPLDGYDLIHASPPCQAYTKAQRIMNYRHPDLIARTRERLLPSGTPWIIENVPGAPLHDPVTLCGLMFGLDVDRDRLFEASFPIIPPPHPAHDRPKRKMGRPPLPGEIIQVVGHFSDVAYARRAMGIDWMMRDELAEAIPPAFTEFVASFVGSDRSEARSRAV
jgi:DNA (cytosine-5)-methyltransferase 1